MARGIMNKILCSAEDQRKMETERSAENCSTGPVDTIACRTGRTCVIERERQAEQVGIGDYSQPQGDSYVG